MTLPGIPAPLTWLNAPASSTLADTLSITAAPETDWFIDPAGGTVKSNAPALLFAPPDPVFRLEAEVAADLAATYDAGALVLYLGATSWAKLCLERSPQGQQMLVSVVTRGHSDDCNSEALAYPRVYLRLYGAGSAFAFHASQDGRTWHLLRHFRLEGDGPLRAGFLAQSPTGRGCTATFAAWRYLPEPLADLRNGE